MVRFFVVLIFSYVFTITGCSHSVDPIIPQSKDPRTYTWTVDTLYFSPTPNDFGQTVMMDIWGLNDTLIYVVGHDANYGVGSMWVFNGKKWTRVHIIDHDGGTLNKVIDFYAVRGFAENDVYAFGTSWSNFTGENLPSTAGIHYDGIQWREINLPQGKGIFSLAAPSPSMMYCGGEYNGQLYHYDGIKWSVDTITTSPFPDLGIKVNVIGTSSTQDVYLQTVQFKNVSGGFTYWQTIKRTNNKSIVLDSALNDPSWGGRSFWQSKAGKIYSCGTGGIFLLSGDKWEPFYSPEVIGSIFGINDQHMFAVGISNIYFYDGKNWEIIRPNFGRTYAQRLWCSDKEVFILYDDNHKTYVLHGK